MANPPHRRAQLRLIGKPVPVGVQECLPPGGIGLDLMLAILAPHDQPDLGSGGVPQRHRRAGLGFHARVIRDDAVLTLP